MNFAVQHLSDEAVAAYADGMLATPAHNRASRHLAQCGECAAAVAEQRAAVSALRAAPAPSMPAGLLDRLRAVPVTTPLSLKPSAPIALAPDGSAVFAAFGTSSPPAAATDPAQSSASTVSAASAAVVPYHFPVAVPHRISRRTQQLAIVAAAAAMITVGMAASAAGSTAGSGRSPSVGPGAPSPQLVSTQRRSDSQLQLVNAVSGRH